MVAFREIRYRRSILLYLLAIVAPALVLLYFGVESFERQREAVSTLLQSNLRLSGEKLAGELERSARERAQACLRDAAAAASNAALANLRTKHPIARYFFMMQSGQVIYPPLRTPPPVSLDEVIAGEQPAVRGEYAAAFREGEVLEVQRENPEAALAVYRKASGLPVSDRLKALALQRVARCLQKTNHAAEAARVFGLLAEKYGDLTDLSHRPYALLAALADQPSGTRKSRLLEDLLAGRWPLSAEQTDYFVSQLGAVPDAKQGYPAHLRFARALEEQFRQTTPLHSDEVHAFAFATKDGWQQTFYRAADGAAGRLVGFAADSDWIRTQLLAESRARLRIGAAARLVERDAPHAKASEVRAGFTSLFSFWNVVIMAPAESPGRGGLLAHAAITGLVLCLLLMGVVFLIRDVSRERRVNQLRADFVGAVSHELKTPITLIRLYAETLLDDEDFQPAERRDFYQIIARESDRLTQLIEKVLAFSRIERGEKQYHLECADLAPVVSRTIEVYEQYLRRRGFSVETDLAVELPPVKFDADAVSQALVNLLDNAAKYSGDTKAIAVRSYAAEGNVMLEVEDHGIGIARGEHDKIFQRFYRVGNGGAKGGYGLGLYLIRHIMDAHEGKVELDSEPGRGSTFRLIFPQPHSGSPS